ncbi:homing endonuclease associated repeat-containing protein [Vagococcus carniphilus]|uniref:homing endonuclease associated repeat-containing protein n=1 Tax=Vagococcus carniphilus TaxID=218144 RepID=UPI003B5C2A50
MQDYLKIIDNIRTEKYLVTIQNEIQNDRKKILRLLVEVHSQHIPLNDNHTIGDNKNCKICQIFIQLNESDNILREKLKLIQEDKNFIQDFNNLRRSLGRLPQEKEYKNKIEVIERFGSWNNFLNKTQNYFNR